MSSYCLWHSDVSLATYLKLSNPCHTATCGLYPTTTDSLQPRTRCQYKYRLGRGIHVSTINDTKVYARCEHIGTLEGAHSVQQQVNSNNLGFYSFIVLHYTQPLSSSSSDANARTHAARTQLSVLLSVNSDSRTHGCHLKNRIGLITWRHHQLVLAQEYV